MKKILIVLFLAILAVVFFFVEQGKGFRHGLTSALDRAVEYGRELVGLDRPEPGVLAEINGQPITLAEVEALHDMEIVASGMIGSGMDAGPSLEQVRQDYARCLSLLVTQTLIRQELAKAGLSVTDKEVRDMERLLGHGLNEASPTDTQADAEGAFDRHIEEEGLSPAFWRSQLRARLELERWQSVLLGRVVVPSSEVHEYLSAHPEALQEPEQIHCLILSGLSKKVVESTREKAGPSLMAHSLPEGVAMRRIHGSVERVPQIWRKTAAGLEPGQMSALRKTDDVWGCLLLLDRRPARERSPAEAYAYVEALLARERLPQIFDQWLTEAVTRSRILMAHALMPDEA